MNQANTSSTRSIAIGAIGFCLVSLLVFATVAFAETWMYKSLGLTGSYLAWTILFIVLGGAVLRTLILDPQQRKCFYLTFALAFLAYAIGWILCYFVLKGTLGEWIGSLAGSFLMAFVLATRFGVTKKLLVWSAILFVANSLGYFIGSEINGVLGGRLGMLLWGAIYGLFLGAGLGLFLHLTQAKLSG
jgi:hypothetical protein